MDILKRIVVVILCVVAMIFGQQPAKNKTKPQSNKFEIYEIKGAAKSISGVKLEKMDESRLVQERLAELYRGTVFVNMDPAQKVVYLTFDDGPDPVNTVKVINTLKKYGVSATFFFLGEQMVQHKAVVKQVHDAGFAIGLHGHTHTSMKKFTREQLVAELKKSNDVLEKITGTRSTIVRPPYGDIGRKEIETMRGQNFKIYFWSIDTLDWTQGSQEVLQTIKQHLRPGDIILMHATASNSNSADILSQIIEHIQKMGYKMSALPG